MFGDYLIKNISELKDCKNDRTSEGFYETLKKYAIEDIVLVYPSKVDSDKAIEIYRNILKKNINELPDFAKKIVPSNKQYKFEVTVRNIFASNAFHSIGIAKSEKIKAYKVSNPNGGLKTVYQKKGS